MTKHTVLVAEDDDSIRLVISQTLTADGYAVRATSSVDALKKWVREGEGDVVVTDVYLGESSIFDSMQSISCLLYTSPSPRDQRGSRMPSSA